MKQKTPTGIKVIRGVSIAITLIIFLVIGTVVYSAYEDYNGVKAELTGASPQAAGRAVMLGSSEIVSINITVPNRGLYTLQVSVACKPMLNVVCAPTEVSVPAGQQGVLRFKMTVVDLSQFVSSNNHKINGTLTTQLVPFASLALGVDFGGFVTQGGK